MSTDWLTPSPVADSISAMLATIRPGRGVWLGSRPAPGLMSQEKAGTRTPRPPLLDAEEDACVLPPAVGSLVDAVPPPLPHAARSSPAASGSAIAAPLPVVMAAHCAASPCEGATPRRPLCRVLTRRVTVVRRAYNPAR